LAQIWHSFKNVAIQELTLASYNPHFSFSFFQIYYDSKAFNPLILKKFFLSGMI